MLKLLKNVLIGASFMALAFFLSGANTTHASAIASNGTGGGAWGSTATWSGAVVPTSGDTVTLAGTDTVTLASGAAAATSLAVANGTTFTITGGTVTIPTITATGTGAVTNTGGTVTVATALSGTGHFTNAAGGTLNLGGASGITNLVASASGNTVNYTGSGQTVKNITYDNLTLSSTGTTTMGATTINSNLTVTGGIAALTGNSTCNKLYLGNVVVRAGSYGSSSSSAVYKNDTFFSNTSKVTAADGKSVSFGGDISGGTPTVDTSTPPVTPPPTTTTVTPPTPPATPAAPVLPEGCKAGDISSATTGAPCNSSTTPATGGLIVTATKGIEMISGNLTLGAKGDDVKTLQDFLIAQAKGAKAAALTKIGSTSNFGPMTKAALMEWQMANGIKPASGFFGPMTRAKIAALGL